MKKISCIIFLAVFGVLALASSAGAASTFSFSPASISARAGETFALRIGFDPQGVKNYTVKAALEFPADLVKVNGFTFGSNWMPLAQAGYDAVDNVNGILVKTAGYPGGISAPATFGTVSLTAKKDGSGAIKITGSSLALDAENKNALSPSFAQMSVVIKTPVETPAKTPAKPPAKTPAEPAAETLIEKVKKPAETISTPKVEGTVEGAVRGEEVSPAPGEGGQIISVPPIEGAVEETGAPAQSAGEASKIAAGEGAAGSVLSLGTNKIWAAFVAGAVMMFLAVVVIPLLMRRRKKKTEKFD